MGGYRLSSYQGIADAGKISARTIADGLENMGIQLLRFYFRLFHWSYYSLLNAAAAVVWIWLFVNCILLNKELNVRRKGTVLVIFLFSLPLTYSFYFVSDGVRYHSVMEFGNIFIYYSILIMAKNITTKCKSGRLLEMCSILLLMALGYYHSLNANVVYKEMEMSAEQTRFEVSEILMKIDSIADGDDNMLAMIGYYQTKGMSARPIPDMIGIAPNYMTGMSSFIIYSRYYYARNFTPCPSELMDEIKASEEFSDMDCYPYGDYVRNIDGTIVVKLSE